MRGLQSGIWFLSVVILKTEICIEVRQGLSLIVFNLFLIEIQSKKYINIATQNTHTLLNH